MKHGCNTDEDKRVLQDNRNHAIIFSLLVSIRVASVFHPWLLIRDLLRS
jgi:hypothetical protein